MIGYDSTNAAGQAIAIREKIYSFVLSYFAFIYKDTPRLSFNITAAQETIKFASEIIFSAFEYYVCESEKENDKITKKPLAKYYLASIFYYEPSFDFENSTLQQVEELGAIYTKQLFQENIEFFINKVKEKEQSNLINTLPSFEEDWKYYAWAMLKTSYSDQFLNIIQQPVVIPSRRNIPINTTLLNGDIIHSTKRVGYYLAEEITTETSLIRGDPKNKNNSGYYGYDFPRIPTEDDEQATKTQKWFKDLQDYMAKFNADQWSVNHHWNLNGTGTVSYENHRAEKIYNLPHLKDLTSDFIWEDSPNIVKCAVSVDGSGNPNYIDLSNTKTSVGNTDFYEYNGDNTINDLTKKYNLKDESELFTSYYFTQIASNEDNKTDLQLLGEIEKQATVGAFEDYYKTIYRENWFVKLWFSVVGFGGLTVVFESVLLSIGGFLKWAVGEIFGFDEESKTKIKYTITYPPRYIPDLSDKTRENLRNNLELASFFEFSFVPNLEKIKSKFPNIYINESNFNVLKQNYYLNLSKVEAYDFMTSLTAKNRTSISSDSYDVHKKYNNKEEINTSIQHFNYVLQAVQDYEPVDTASTAPANETTTAEQQDFIENKAALSFIYEVTKSSLSKEEFSELSLIPSFTSYFNVSQSYDLKQYPVKDLIPEIEKIIEKYQGYLVFFAQYEQFVKANITENLTEEEFAQLFDVNVSLLYKLSKKYQNQIPWYSKTQFTTLGYRTTIIGMGKVTYGEDKDKDIYDLATYSLYNPGADPSEALQFTRAHIKGLNLGNAVDFGIKSIAKFNPSYYFSDDNNAKKFLDTLINSKETYAEDIINEFKKNLNYNPFESYSVLKEILALDAAQIPQVFATYNKEILAKAYSETSKNLLDNLINNIDKI